MPSNNTILIASPTAAGCDELSGLLESEPATTIRKQVIDGGRAELNAGAVDTPQLIVLDLGDRGEQTLRDWTGRARALHVPMIIVGPANDSATMRRAMQAGARDYVTRPLEVDEIQAAVRRVLHETNEATRPAHLGQLTAVIDAKGGSGASFLACNLAHIIAVHSGRETALIDMDLQFGALPLALNLKPRDTLFDAIAAADRLDPVALKGYLTRHASGLHVLGTMSEQLAMPWEVSVEAAQRVLDMALQSFEHVVVDLPRQIDPLTSMVLTKADRVLLVMQQSFAHLRDAQRMFGLLSGYLGLPKDRIWLVINRYMERAPIGEADIRKAIAAATIVRVANDFGHVSEALNLGVPVYEGARNTDVTEALCRLATQIAGQAEAPSNAGRGLQRIFGIKERRT